jgi:hypothetical protein
VVIENIKENCIKNWYGTSLFTGSKKLEHGKTRAIFGSDTFSYLSFHHLLAPIEKTWVGRRIVLDPGGLGTQGMVSRVRKLWERNGINIMLDYDDFNSQHSNLTMKTLIAELIDYTGYDRVLGAKLIESFDRSRLYVGGEYIGQVKGTLMSGHRGTSFINSVLNMAYAVTVYPELWAMDSVHVGDDVYIASKSLNDTANLMTAIRDSTMRVNPLKQSIGSYSAEFLRIGINRNCAFGYLSRAISSVVSGNWESDSALTPLEALTSLVSTSWTLCNRSNNSDFWKCILSATVRATKQPRNLVARLLEGSLTLGEGPARGRRAEIHKLLVTVVVTKKQDDRELDVVLKHRDLKRYATSEYLSKHIQPFEREILDKLNISVSDMMVSASYAKTFNNVGLTQPDRVEFTISPEIKTVNVVKSVDIETLLKNKIQEGVLSRYPILCMIKNRLSNLDLDFIIRNLGLRYNGDDLQGFCWGEGSHSVAVVGAMTYSDACRFRARTKAGCITTRYPIYG